LLIDWSVDTQNLEDLLVTSPFNLINPNFQENLIPRIIPLQHKTT